MCPSGSVRCSTWALPSGLHSAALWDFSCLYLARLSSLVCCLLLTVLRKAIFCGFVHMLLFVSFILIFKVLFSIYLLYSVIAYSVVLGCNTRLLKFKVYYSSHRLFLVVLSLHACYCLVLLVEYHSRGVFLLFQCGSFCLFLRPLHIQNWYFLSRL